MKIILPFTFHLSEENKYLFMEWPIRIGIGWYFLENNYTYIYSYSAKIDEYLGQIKHIIQNDKYTSMQFIWEENKQIHIESVDLIGQIRYLRKWEDRIESFFHRDIGKWFIENTFIINQYGKKIQICVNRFCIKVNLKLWSSPKCANNEYYYYYSILTYMKEIYFNFYIKNKIWTN